MDIFAAKDDIDLIQKFLAENKHIKGIKSKMAAAAGCQLSYLSQALANKVHLTPDHGFGIANFLRLSEIEKEYFLLLIHLKRAGERDHRAYLKEKVERMQKENFKLESKIKAVGRVSDAGLQRYYSDWRMQAIHMYLTIPKYQRLNSLGAKLGIDELDLLALLQALADMGLAKKEGESWAAISKDLHVPIRSPHSLATQFQWKMRALQDLQMHDSSGVHYVSTFSLSRADIENIKAMVIEFLARTRNIAQASSEEEVAHLGVSFFGLKV